MSFTAASLPPGCKNIFGGVQVCSTSDGPVIKWPDELVYSASGIQEMCGQSGARSDLPNGLTCENFLKNMGNVNALSNHQSELRSVGLSKMVDALGACQVPQVKEYIQWRVNSGNIPQLPAMALNGVCKLGMDPSVLAKLPRH